MVSIFSNVLPNNGSIQEQAMSYDYECDNDNHDIGCQCPGRTPDLVAAVVEKHGDWWGLICRWWDRRGLEPGDPATHEWREYRRECRRIDSANAGPGGYQSYPKQPGWTP